MRCRNLTENRRGSINRMHTTELRDEFKNDTRIIKVPEEQEDKFDEKPQKNLR